MVTAEEWLCVNLAEIASELRMREARARRAYTRGSLKEATQELANCYAAAALIFEIELARRRLTSDEGGGCNTAS